MRKWVKSFICFSMLIYSFTYNVSATTIKSYTNFSRNIGKIDFAKDQGVHNKFNTEWWYYNLDLNDSLGNEYRGFVGIARNNILVGSEVPVMVVRLSDTKNRVNYSKIIMGSLQAQEDKTDLIFNGKSGSDLVSFSWKEISPYTFGVDFKAAGQQISLTFTNNKRPLVEGGDGQVPIGGGIKSYYYSFTNMMAVGTITADNKKVSVSGRSWVDHQWFNLNAPNSNFRGMAPFTGFGGHEWFSMQFDNNIELICWSIKTGTNITKYLGIIDDKGNQVDVTNFNISPLSYWISPTGERFANKWQISGDNFNIIVKTQIPDQTILLPTCINIGNLKSFYEGGTTIEGKLGSKAVKGVGYAELTKTY